MSTLFTKIINQDIPSYKIKEDNLFGFSGAGKNIHDINYKGRKRVMDLCRDWQWGRGRLDV